MTFRGGSKSSNDTFLTVAMGSAAAAELSLFGYHGKEKRDLHSGVKTGVQRETVGARATMKSECCDGFLRVPSAAAVPPETLPLAGGHVTASSSSSLHCAAALPAGAAPGEVAANPEAVFTSSSRDSNGVVYARSSSNKKTCPGNSSTSRSASSTSSFSSSSDSSSHHRWLVTAAGGRGVEGEEDSSQLDICGKPHDGSRTSKEAMSNSSNSEVGCGSGMTNVKKVYASSESSSNDRNSNSGGNAGSSNGRISPSRVRDGTGNLNKNNASIKENKEGSLPALRESDQKRMEQIEMEAFLARAHPSSACFRPEIGSSTSRFDVSFSQQQLQRLQQTVSSTNRSSRARDNHEDNSETHNSKDNSEDKLEDVLLQGSEGKIVSSRESNDSICFCCGGGGEVVCCEGCPKTYHVDCLAAAGYIPPRQMDEDWLCPYCLAAASAAAKKRDIHSRCSGDGSSSKDDANFSRSSSSSFDRNNSMRVCNAETSPPLEDLQMQQLEQRQLAGVLLSAEDSPCVPSIQCGDTASLGDGLNDEAGAAVMAGDDTAAPGSGTDAEAAATDAHRETESETEARAAAETDETATREKRTTATGGGGDTSSTARRHTVPEGDNSVIIKYVTVATVEEEGMLWKANETAAEQQQQQHNSRRNASAPTQPASPGEAAGEETLLAFTSSLVEDSHVVQQRRGVSGSTAGAQCGVDRVGGAVEKDADTVSTPRLAATAAADGTEEGLAAASSALPETFASSPALSSLSQETVQLQQEDDLLMQLEEQQEQPEREEELQEREGGSQQKAEEPEEVQEGPEEDGHVETKLLFEETQQQQDEKPLQSGKEQGKLVLQKEQQPHGMVPTTRRGEKPTATVESPSTAGPLPGQVVKGLDNHLLSSPTAAAEAAAPGVAAEVVAPAAAAAIVARIAASGVSAPAAAPATVAAPASGGGGVTSNRKATCAAAGVARQTATANAICGSSSSSSSGSYCIPPSEGTAGFTPAAGGAGGKAAVENSLQLATGDTSATTGGGGTCLAGARKRRRRGDEQRINVGPDYQVPHLPQFYLLRTYEAERLLLSSPAGYIYSVRAPPECSPLPHPLVGEGSDFLHFGRFPRATAAAASRCPPSASAKSGWSSFPVFSSSFSVSSSPSPLLCDWEFLPAYSSSRSGSCGEKDDCLWEDGLRSSFFKQRHTDADLRHPLLEPRLVYSPHCMETRRQLCAALRKNSDSNAKPGVNYHCVNTHQELAKFIEDCAKKWKARPGWQPYSPEFAYKLLHRADYDPQRALSMLDDPGFSFIDMCDPPMRKYENKWKRRDKRGTYPPSPYPPPVVIRAYLQERVRTMRNR